jgi:hypothetical protein
MPSIAWTWKVCEPSARPVYVCGLVQAANGPPSSLHSKAATPDHASVPLKLKLALELLLEFAGWLVIVVSGGVVSTIQVKLASGPTLPSVSLA